MHSYTRLRYVQALPTAVHYPTPHTHTLRELSGRMIGRAQFPPASLQWATKLGSHGNRRVYDHLSQPAESRSTSVTVCVVCGVGGDIVIASCIGTTIILTVPRSQYNDVREYPSVCIYNKGTPVCVYCVCVCVVCEECI